MSRKGCPEVDEKKWRYQNEYPEVEEASCNG
jgi:hypothetical protein